MDDSSILGRIQSLVEEEQALRESERSDAVDDRALAQDRQRLEEVSVELDRCWDLLRQRRALREAGGDPGDAVARDPETVEKYLQ